MAHTLTKLSDLFAAYLDLVQAHEEPVELRMSFENYEWYRENALKEGEPVLFLGCVIVPDRDEPGFRFRMERTQ